MGLGLVVAIVGTCWSWGWPVDIGEGAIFGPKFRLADLTRMEPPLGCGFLGQSVLVVVYDGSHERLPYGWGCGPVSLGVRWY